MLCRQDGQRIHRVDGAFAKDFDIAGLGPWKPLCGQLRHLQPLRRTCAQMRLVRRTTRREEQHAIQVKGLARLGSNAHMPYVNGVKTAAH